MAKVGERYYFITHAYHHFVGEIAEVLGRNYFVLCRVRKVHSCRRGWEEFFRDGFGDDTQYAVCPDGAEVEGSCVKFPWRHDIPDRGNLNDATG